MHAGAQQDDKGRKCPEDSAITKFQPGFHFLAVQRSSKELACRGRLQHAASRPDSRRRLLESLTQHASPQPQRARGAAHDAVLLSGSSTGKPRRIEISAICSSANPTDHPLLHTSEEPPEVPRLHITLPPSKDATPPSSVRARSQDSSRDSLEQFYDALDHLDLEDGLEACSPVLQEPMADITTRCVEPARVAKPDSGHLHSGYQALVGTVGAQPALQQGQQQQHLAIFPVRASAGGEDGAYAPVEGAAEADSLSALSPLESPDSPASYTGECAQVEAIPEGSIGVNRHSSSGEFEEGPKQHLTGLEFAAVNRLEVNELYYDAPDRPNALSPSKSLPSPLTEKNLWLSPGSSREAKLESIQRALRSLLMTQTPSTGMRLKYLSKQFLYSDY